VADHFSYPRHRVTTINRELLRAGKTQFGCWFAGEANHNTGQRAKQFCWTLPLDTLLVMDECHADSGQTSLQSQILRAAVAQGVKILALSGTAADDPRKMRAIGYMLGLHQDSNFFQWLYQQGATPDSWTCGLPDHQLTGEHGKALLESKRKAVMGRIHAQLTAAGRMIHLPTSDIPGFPRCSVQPVKVDFGAIGLEAVYAEMAVELKKIRGAFSGNKIEERLLLMRLRQKTELMEVPGLVDQVNDAIAEGQSVAVFLNFRDSVKALATRLNTDCIVIGDDHPEVREANRLKFERDDSRVIVVSKSCGSESISFADRRGVYPRLGLVIPGYQAHIERQVLGRLPRDGAKSASIYRYIFAAGTVEERAYEALKRRSDRFDAFNGLTDEDLQVLE
jgi:superfamily II DNA or RNA helicase